MRLFIVLSTVLVAALALPSPAELPEPGQLALLLNEDDFEDYLDTWLDIEQRKYGNVSQIEPRSGIYLITLTFLIILLQ